MITNYIKPQLLIRQLLEVLPSVTEPSLNAFIYGPQWKLNRYTEKEERAEMRGTSFEARTEPEERQYIPYEGVLVADNVDLSEVRLFAEDMEVSLATVDSSVGATETSPNAFFWNNPSRPNELILRNQGGDPWGDNEVNLYDPAAAELAVELDGRPVSIGDLVIVTENILAGQPDKVHRRRIIDVKQSTEKSSIGDLLCGGKNLEDSAAEAKAITEAINGISSMGDISISVDQNEINTKAEFAKVGSNYGGKLKEKFNVRFTKLATEAADGECKIRTVSDNFEANDVVVAHDGTDATFTVPNSGINVSITVSQINAGDSFDFTVECDYTELDCIKSGDSGGVDATITGEYLHKQDSTVLVTCLEGDVDGADSVWQISDTSGMEDVVEIPGSALTSGSGFGASGLTITLSKTEHVAGEEFGWPCVAKGQTGLYSVLVLDAPVGDLELIDEDELNGTAVTKVEIRGTFAGEVARRGLNAPREQWTAEEAGVRIEADFAFEAWGFGDDQDESRLCKFASADATGPLLFASYRELIPAGNNEKIVKVSTASELYQFGSKDTGNPLGFGAAAAFAGSQGKAIYVGRVKSNDVDGFRSVLERAENIDSLYAHAPMSEDLDVLLDVRAHVDSMSVETSKKWRRAYVATPLPGDYRVLGGPDASPTTATITPSENGNVVVSDPEGKFISAKVKEGDMFRVNFTSNSWGDALYDDFADGGYIVHDVLDEETILLKSGPSKSLNVPRRYEVWKKDTAENIAEFMAARSSSFGSRRVSNIFCDEPQYLNDDNEFVSLHPMYLAAEIAGLRTAVLAQQGLTNTEIALVASAPSMYVKYNQAQLDLIAANGSFIVTQEYEDGPRFIRHQLTTKTDSGNLYYEDSVGVNVDDISFQVKYQLRPYIGRRNVNPETVSDIFLDMYDILSDATDDPGFGNSIGPALIGFTDLVVRINDTFKDRIDVSAKLEVPLPLNVIDVTLHATASFNTGEVTLESIGVTEGGVLLNPGTTAYSTDGVPINPIYAE